MHQIQPECSCGGKLFPVNVSVDASVDRSRRCRSCGAVWAVNAVPLVPIPGETVRRWDVVWRCTSSEMEKPLAGEEVRQTLEEIF